MRGCGPEPLAMPHRRLSHPACLQPRCASWRALTWPDIVSRDRQLRSERVLRFWLASLAPATGSVAEEVKYSFVMERSTCRCGPFGVDLQLVWSALNACLNVDAWASPAYVGCLYMPAGRPVGLKSIGDRACAWRATPSMPRMDPVWDMTGPEK